MVTGAAGGVGSAYAAGLASRGFDLLLVGRPGSPLQELANRLSHKHGVKAEAAYCDLAAPADLEQLAARIADDSTVNLLANIAGAATFSSFASITSQQINRTIDVNVTALTRLSQAVVPGFVTRGGGTIVNFASILAFHPWPEFNVYNAAKAYVVALSQSMQGELRDKGVLVQVVAPPATATPFWAHAGFSYSHLPPAAVMERDDLVSAALAGLDKSEEWVLPSLAETAVWDKYQEARGGLVGGLMRGALADRYKS